MTSDLRLDGVLIARASRAYEQGSTERDEYAARDRSQGGWSLRAKAEAAVLPRKREANVCDCAATGVGTSTKGSCALAKRNELSSVRASEQN